MYVTALKSQWGTIFA